jgi:hypothetical protein
VAPAGLRRALEIVVAREGGAELGEPVGAGERKVALDAEGVVVGFEAMHGGVLSALGR